MEVLRRAHSPKDAPQQQQDSQPDDDHGIPDVPQPASNSIAVQTEVALGVADIGVEEYVDEEEDDVGSIALRGHDGDVEEDILVPDLDYEVRRGALGKRLRLRSRARSGLAPFCRDCCG